MIDRLNISRKWKALLKIHFFVGKKRKVDIKINLKRSGTQEEKEILETLKRKKTEINGMAKDMAEGLHCNDVTQGSIIIEFEADNEVSLRLLEERINTGSIKSLLRKLLAMGGFKSDSPIDVDIKLQNTTEDQKGAFQNLLQRKQSL